MNYKEQPWRGIVFLVASFVLTAVWFSVLSALGLDSFAIGMNWSFCFFLSGYGILVFFEGWPLADKMKQPWAGFLTGAIALAITGAAWGILDSWIGSVNAFAWLSYSQFFVFTIGWFYHNEPFAKRKQPMKGILLFLLAGVGGYVLYRILGPRDWEYLFYIPQWLFYFFLDWPISSSKPYAKGAFWTVVILGFTWVTNLIFNAIGTPIGSARGIDLLALVFGGIMLGYAFEGWPFAKKKQPAQGLLYIISVLVLTVIAYPIIFNFFGAGEYAVNNWVFTAWVWFCVIFYMTWPWPSEPAE